MMIAILPNALNHRFILNVTYITEYAIYWREYKLLH